MTTEIKPARKRVIVGSALPDHEKVQRFARTDPNWYVPFEDDADYIRATKWDKRVGWVLAVIGATYLIGLFTGVL